MFWGYLLRLAYSDLACPSVNKGGERKEKGRLSSGIDGQDFQVF